MEYGGNSMNMNIIRLSAVLFVALVTQATAQNAIRITSCGDAKPPAGASNVYMDANGNLCTSAVAGSAINTPIAPALVSITTTGTVVPAGTKWAVVSNATASGGGTLTLNLFGTAAVINTGIVLQPGQVATIFGQPIGTAITGICSTGTCTVGVQAGS